MNTDKTKVMVFGRGFHRSEYAVKYGNELLKVVNEFSYLGITIQSDGSFKPCERVAKDKGLRALFRLNKINYEVGGVPIKTFLKLFDAIVASIMMYGCELWGFGDGENSWEVVHRKALKKLLGLRDSTPNAALMGDLGRYPLKIMMIKRVVKYWLRFGDLDDSRLVKEAFNGMMEWGLNAFLAKRCKECV